MTALGLGTCLSLALALLLASPAPSTVSASFLVSWFSSAEGQQGDGDCYRQCRQVAVPLLGEMYKNLTVDKDVLICSQPDSSPCSQVHDRGGLLHPPDGGGHPERGRLRRGRLPRRPAGNPGGGGSGGGLAGVRGDGPVRRGARPAVPGPEEAQEQEAGRTGRGGGQAPEGGHRLPRSHAGIRRRLRRIESGRLVGGAGLEGRTFWVSYDFKCSNFPY